MSDLWCEFAKKYEVWQNKILAKESKKAVDEAINMVQYYKASLLSGSVMKEQEKNQLLVCAIFSKAIQDFSEIGVVTGDSQWQIDKGNIELVWGKMWDCKQRLEVVLQYAQGNVIDYLLERLNSLEKYFLQLIGKGLYSSPVIRFKSLHCNICNSNYKYCDHERRMIYNGVLCSPIQIDPKIISSDIVLVPKDPRCRIWRWQVSEDYKITTCIKTFFEVDDFMRE